MGARHIVRVNDNTAGCWVMILVGFKVCSVRSWPVSVGVPPCSWTCRTVSCLGTDSQGRNLGQGKVACRAVCASRHFVCVLNWLDFVVTKSVSVIFGLITRARPPPPFPPPTSLPFKSICLNFTVKSFTRNIRVNVRWFFRGTCPLITSD